MVVGARSFTSNWEECSKVSADERVLLLLLAKMVLQTVPLKVDDAELRRAILKIEQAEDRERDKIWKKKKQ